MPHRRDEAADLIRHIEAQGCVFVREGGKHTVYRNPATGLATTIPRHREIRNTWPERFVTTWELPARMHHSSDRRPPHAFYVTWPLVK